MKTTAQYLDQVKAKHGLTSDYQLAKALGTSRQQISKYRSGRDAFSDYVALKVADLLEGDVLSVIASRNAERAKNPEEQRAWRVLATTATAALFFLAVIAVMTPDDALASAGALCIMLSLALLKKPRLQPI